MIKFVSLNITKGYLYTCIRTAGYFFTCIRTAGYFFTCIRTAGLKALSHVVKINSGYALEHQDVVIDCLEHSDPTIQRKVLYLLYM